MTTTTTWTAAEPTPLSGLINHVDMRFGEQVAVRLTIRSEKPLPAGVWARIGYSASDVANLAKHIDDVIAPPPVDESDD